MSDRIKNLALLQGQVDSLLALNADLAKVTAAIEATVGNSATFALYTAQTNIREAMGRMMLHAYETQMFTIEAKTGPA